MTLKASQAKSRLTGYAFAAIGAALFSSKAIAIKLAYDGTVDAETLLAMRMALALPVYAVIGALALRERRAHGGAKIPTRTMLMAAAVGALGYWLASYTDFVGLQYISADFERLILFTYPLFVVVFGALFFHQPVRGRVLLAFFVAYGGIAVIFADQPAGATHDVAFGVGAVLIAAIAFAFYQLFAKDLIPAFGSALFTCIAMGSAALVVFVQLIATHSLSDIHPSANVWACAVFLAIGATVIPSFFLNAALARVSAQANSTIATLSPVVTIILSVIVLGEPVTWAEALGAVLVLAGVGWFTLAHGRKREPVTPDDEAV